VAKAAKYATWLKRFEKGAQWPAVTPIVGVLWGDATFHDGPAETAHGVIAALTVGVVVRADKNMVKVAHEVFEDESERGITTIPAGMIRGVVTFAAPPTFKA
jgi:hypothetical protein